MCRSTSLTMCGDRQFGAPIRRFGIPLDSGLVSALAPESTSVLSSPAGLAGVDGAGALAGSVADCTLTLHFSATMDTTATAVTEDTGEGDTGTADLLHGPTTQATEWVFPTPIRR